MTTEKQPNAQTVYIRRKALSIPEEEALSGSKPEIKNYFDMAHRAVGSYWPKGSQRPGTGLTLSEENLLMPYVLNISAEDRDFREKSTTFFHEISTTIEPVNEKGEGGTPLQIGRPNPNEPISSTNLPYNISDFIKYRHIVGDGINPGHPKGALSKEEADGNPIKEFYIHNEEVVTKQTVDTSELKVEAYSVYLKIHKDPAQVLEYLTLLKINVNDFKGREQAKLQEVVDKEPAKIVKISKDPNRVPKALLMELVGANILHTVGTRVLITENDVQIGVDTKEAIAYLRDVTNNSKQISIFKAQLQEAKKNKNKT